jgi:hypothetical protein
LEGEKPLKKKVFPFIGDERLLAFDQGSVCQSSLGLRILRRLAQARE